MRSTTGLWSRHWLASRALYADLEQQKRDVDRELRDVGRAQPEKPARLRSS